MEHGRVGALRKIREIGFQIRGIRDELLSLFSSASVRVLLSRLSRGAQVTRDSSAMTLYQRAVQGSRQAAMTLSHADKLAAS